MAQADLLALTTQPLVFAFSSTTREKNPSTPVLDFGGDVVLKRAVTRQLLITNHTAVPAPFTVEAEYFTCHAAKPNNQSENG